MMVFEDIVMMEEYVGWGVMGEMKVGMGIWVDWGVGMGKEV